MSLDVGPSVAGSPRFDVSDVDGFELLSGAERDEVFMDVERQIRRLQAVQALRLQRVGRCGSYMDDGPDGTEIAPRWRPKPDPPNPP